MDNPEENIVKSYTSKGLKSLSDTRKPGLTLKHLNKLKKIHAIRKMDVIKRNSLLSVMYGSKDEEGGL